MFANTFQSGFISIFYSVGSNPLQLWDKQVKNGHIRRIVDDEVRSLVLEIAGTNVATTYITCPIKPRLSLGIKLPFLVMIIKNMKKYFTFEIQILDDKDMHRRFRVSNFQSTTKVRPFCTTMPIGLSSGWNQVQFNLADFTKRAYGSTYLETTRVQIHANVRIRRIYFSDVLYSDEDLPNEYKLFVPTPGTQTVQRPSQKKDFKIEKKPSKEQVPAEAQPDQEPPSGAPPTPTEAETAREEPPSEEPPQEEQQPPAEPLPEEPAPEEADIQEGEKPEEVPAEEVAVAEGEAPSEVPESTAETTEVTETITTEAAPEAEVFVDAQENLEVVGDAPAEVPEGGAEEVAVVEEVVAPAEEQAPAAEQAPAEVQEEPVEESAPAEEPPAEEEAAA